MKTKLFKVRAAIALTVAVMAFGSSCKDDDNSKTPPKEFTVSFNSNGGNEVAAQTVVEGDKATKPINPTKDGFTFVAWYKDNNTFADEWNFATETVTADVTLFANWSAVTFEVTFNSNGGSAVSKQTVAQGGKADKPAPDPTKEGFNFAGWFTDNNTFANEWDFAVHTVTEDITLFVKWTEISGSWVNITADVLKNTKEPFSRGTDLVVHLGGTRYFYQIEDWTVNAALAPHGTVIDNGIDVRNIIGFRTLNGESNPETITNGKMYQTVMLEAGKYRFDTHPHYVDYSGGGGLLNPYSVAALGNDLPDTDAVEVEDNALGFVRLPDVNYFGGYYQYPVFSFEFIVPEKGKVSLGFVVTINNAMIYIWKVELWAYR